MTKTVSQKNSETSRCPVRYQPLRARILCLLDRNEARFLLKLRKHLRNNYPRLFNRCFVPPVQKDGKTAGRGTFLIEKLYRILDIQLNRNCLECGRLTQFNPIFLKWRDFCSVKCAASSERTRGLYRETCKKVWGADNFRSSEKGKKVIADSWKRRYGCHPLQTSKVLKQVMNSQLRVKEYRDSSGQKHAYQGYEDTVLRFLDSSSAVTKFTTDVPGIRYSLDGIERKYFPDVACKLRNGRKLLIEVKSSYTLKADLEKNLSKFAATIDVCRNKEWEFWLAIVDGKTRKTTWIKNPRRSTLDI